MRHDPCTPLLGLHSIPPIDVLTGRDGIDPNPDLSDMAQVNEHTLWRRRTAGGAAALLVGVAAFQAAAVLGAPVGSFTQGGQHPGVLTAAGRAVAAVSALLLVVMAVVIVGRVGTSAAARWQARHLTLAWRAVVGIEIVTLAADVASRSIYEKVAFVPVAALALLLTITSGHTRRAPAGNVRQAWTPPQSDSTTR